MHNRLVGWLIGAPPKMVGVYWGDHGSCFIYRPTVGDPLVAYEPASKTADAPIWESTLTRLEAISGVSRRNISLAIALSADDVFLRSMTVPLGLSDAQLDQIAIVEAVANLPVPPEEICLDFVREGPVDTNNEQVNLAFCRRERMDEILACAEEVSVPAWVVDRDVQAIHDAINAELADANVTLAYPFGVLLTDLSPRLLICLSASRIETYPIRLDQSSLDDEISNCWVRCRLSLSLATEQLSQIVVVGDLLETALGVLEGIAEKTGAEMVRYSPRHIDKSSLMGTQPPSPEVFLVALGMAFRRLS